MWFKDGVKRSEVNFIKDTIKPGARYWNTQGEVIDSDASPGVYPSAKKLPCADSNPSE